MKKIISLGILLLVAMLCLTGCKKKEENNTMENTNTQETTSENNTQNNTNTTESNTNTTDSKEKTSVDYAQNAQKQMAEPAEGEEIAILHIKNYGDVYFKFFPDVAPKAVENFKTHSKNGYYNGLTFHRVINEFMIQGGDPKGDGTGGESIWNKGFGTELDESLVPYRGSLCMAMSSMPNSIGSQFFITQANYDEKMAKSLKSYGYPEGLIEQTKTYGGYLSLYMQYTVFGQAFKGMDIVDKVASVKTNSDDKPVEDVIIESIEITNYTK